MDTRDQTLTKLTDYMINLIQPITVQQAYDGIIHARGEHHDIGDGGRLMMTTTTNPPLRRPKQTLDQHSREVLGLGGSSIS